MTPIVPASEETAMPVPKPGLQMRRQSPPLLVNLEAERSVTKLARVEFRKKGAGAYEEGWIQDLVHECPSVLPITSIESNFWPAAAVCRELPLSSGFLDNLLVTPTGNLIVVECKLWRNPEALRKVLAQVLDYAKDLQAMSYSDVEQAIRRARNEPSFNLYQFASSAEPDGPSESSFIDAVSRNLRLGRSLIVIVGDGITENVEAMSDFLQQHAGLRFGLALVELAVYEMPSVTAPLLVIPSVPMRTTNIVRGIVEVRDGLPLISAPPEAAHATSLTEEEYFAELDRIQSGTSARLRAFLDDLSDIQISWDVQKTLLVRMTVGDYRVRPFVIDLKGRIDTSYDFNKKDMLRGFEERLAASVPGLVLRETPKAVFVKNASGDFLTVWQLLDNQVGCRAALEVLNRTLHLAAGDT